VTPACPGLKLSDKRNQKPFLKCLTEEKELQSHIDILK